jgi:hypothetical protein
MTRETKVGLIVSCSFLGLLGVVVALKMTERADVEGELDGPAVAQADASPPAPDDHKNAGPEAPAGTLGAKQKPEPTHLPPMGPASDILPTAATSAGGSSSAALPPMPGAGSRPGEKGNHKPTDDALPDIPPPGGSPVTAKQPPAIPAGNEGKSATPAATTVSRDRPPAQKQTGFFSSLWGPPVAKKKPAADVTGGGVAHVGPPLPQKPAGGGTSKPSDPLPDLPAVPGDTSTPMSPGPSIAKGGTAAPPKAGTSGNDSGLPALPAPPPVEDNKDPAQPPLPAVAEGSGGAATAPLRPNPADKTTASTPPPPPAVDVPPTKAPAKGPTISIGQVEVGGSTEKGISIGGPPAAPKAPADEAPAKAPDAIHIGPAAPAAALPASVRGSHPEVVSYTEETLVANPADSYRSISQAKYGTDRYADALYHFNRGHPLADDNLPADGSLLPRQKVYIPPAAILESRYPEQIKAAPKPGVTSGSSPQPAAPATYRVAAGGEFAYDIARKQLGDGNRWIEIQKLNPGWRPEVPIPAGTTIQLPQ